MGRHKPRSIPAPAQTFARPAYIKPDTTIVSNVACDVSRETRNARKRSGAGSKNTVRNRRNGGGSCYMRVHSDELAGRLPAAVSTVDKSGQTEHMATVPPTEDEKMRAHAQMFYRLWNEGV